MNNSIFWKSALRYGAILGLVMALCKVISQIFLLNGQIIPQGGTALLAAVAYFILIVRFTKRYRAGLDSEAGFPFSHAFAFLLITLLVCGLCSVVAELLFRYAIIGNEAYVTGTVANLSAQLSALQGPFGEAFKQSILQMIAQLQSAPAPTLMTILSGFFTAMFSKLIGCAILALILAGFFVKQPKPFKAAE